MNSVKKLCVIGNITELLQIYMKWKNLSMKNVDK